MNNNLHYVEFRSGSCTIVEAPSHERAWTVAATRVFTGVLNDRPVRVRQATDEDVAHYERSGGSIHA